MKVSKLVKIVLITILCLAVIMVAKVSFAAPTDLSGGTLTGNALNSSGSLAGNNVVNNKINTANNNTVLTTNNTSKYNNADLPKTGIEDSMPMVVLTVVLGISAVYAYKKMQDYKNI